MEKENFLSDVREKFATCQAYWSDNFNKYNARLEFLEGISGHWSEDEKAKRERRGQACLTMKVVNKYAKKLVGEIRLNKVSINVTPGSKDADFETAQAIKGKIKDIEYSSSASDIYDYAATQEVEGGLFAWRVLNYYKDDQPFEQDLLISRIENPTCVLIDPNAKKWSFEDADYIFITSNMSKEQFKREFPNKEYPTGSLDEKMSHWVIDDSVVISEYYYKDYYTETMVMLDDNRTMKKEEAEELIENLISQAQQPDFDEFGNPVFPDIKIPKIVKERDCEKFKIKWARLNGVEILDEQDVPGKYIPIVFGTGEMRNINGIKYIRSLIADGMDAARMADYWYTAAAEMVALAPKAKYLLTPEEVSGYEEQFASNDNSPYFLFNKDPQLGRPQLEQPQTPPTAILSQLAQAEENVKGAIGMYDTDLGDQGRELSGAAINARQTPSQVSNFVYYDNLTKAIQYTGKIIVSMLGEVIDTERDIEVRNEDESQNFMPVNTTIAEAMQKFQQEPEKYAGINPTILKNRYEKEGPDADYNNLSKGKYNVYVSVGPAFQTQRIEAAQRFIELMGIAVNSQSQIGLITLYYAAKNLSIEGADEYAESIRKMLPFGAVKPKPGEQPPAPPEPTPQEKMQAEILMMERRNQEAKAAVEEQRLKTEAIKQQRLMLEANIDLEKAKIEKEKSFLDNNLKINKINSDMQKTFNQNNIVGV